MRPESARAPKSSDEPAGGLALTGVVDPPSGGGGGVEDPPSGGGGVEPSSGGGGGGSWNKGPLLKCISDKLIGLAIEISLLNRT